MDTYQKIINAIDVKNNIIMLYLLLENDNKEVKFVASRNRHAFQNTLSQV